MHKTASNSNTMDLSEIEKVIFHSLGKALQEKTENYNNQVDLRIKFEFEDEMRAIQWKQPIKFNDLLSRVEKEFRPNVLLRNFVSKDNQVFQVLKDQKDLDDAIKLVKWGGPNPCLHIQVVPCSVYSTYEGTPPPAIINIFTAPNDKSKASNNSFMSNANISYSPHSSVNSRTPQLSVRSSLSSSSSSSSNTCQSLSLRQTNVNLPSSMEKPNSFPNMKNKKLLKSWKRGRLLGSGAFGQVFLCCDMETGKEYAVKQVHIFSKNSQHCAREANALHEEINILKEGVKHPNIVQYFGCQDDGVVFSILMEYMPGGSVKDQIKQYGPLTERNTVSYTKQVLLGLEYLHKNSIVHRDIKGANILRDIEGNVKLSDFGASKRLQTISNSIMQTQTGTIYYMSPELLNGTGYGRRTDIWSLGCTVVEMLTGHPPWHQLENFAAIFKIVTSDEMGYTLPETVSKHARDFVSQCFTRAFELRPTSSQLLYHPFITFGQLELDKGS